MAQTKAPVIRKIDLPPTKGFKKSMVALEADLIVQQLEKLPPIM